MNTRKIGLSLLTFIIIFLVSSCFKEDVAPQFQEIRRVVSVEDIPNVTSALLNRMGLENSIGRFSVNNGQSEDIFDIDWDKILQLVDSDGQETYTFSIKDNDGNPFAFYNLVIRFNEFGDAFYPFLMRYEMSEEFIPVYLETGSMDKFSGKISKIIIGQPASSNQDNSLNIDPQAPRSITPTSDCPQQDIDMNDGSSDSGGSGGPSIGGPGTGGGSTTYRVCEYYTQDFYWVTISGGEITKVVYDYTILREECYTIVVNHTETPESPECEIGNGDIPILDPDIEADLWEQGICEKSNFKTNSCLNTVWNKLGNTNIAYKTLKNFIGEKPVAELCLDAVAMGTNDLKNATTGTSNSTITITLNSDKLNRSQLSIARTMLHELVHAELFRKVQSVGGNVSPDDFPGIYDYYRRFAKNWQHEQMAGHYVKLIADGLAEFDNNMNSRDIYEAIAWVGLWKFEDKNNPGSLIESAAWKTLTTAEQSTILNRIATYQQNENINCN